MDNRVQNLYNKNGRKIVIKKKGPPPPKKGQRLKMKNKPSGGNKGILQRANKVGLYRAMMAEPSVQHYARVYSDPFCNLSARMPVWPIARTQLYRTKVLAKGVLNSNGYGYVLGTTINGITSDLACLACSTGPTAPDTINSGGPGVTQFTSDSPYQSVTFRNLDQPNGWNTARVVSAGIRVRYTGTVLNMSGNTYACENDPRDLALVGFLPTQITQRAYKEESFANTRWHCVTRMVNDVLDKEFQFLSNANSDNWAYETVEDGQLTLDDFWNLGIYITGVAGASFECEFVGHYEVKGRNLNNVSTTTPNTTQFEKVTSGLMKLRVKDNKTPDNNGGSETKPESFLNKALDGIGFAAKVMDMVI